MADCQQQVLATSFSSMPIPGGYDAGLDGSGAPMDKRLSLGLVRLSWVAEKGPRLTQGKEKTSHLKVP